MRDNKEDASPAHLKSIRRISALSKFLAHPLFITVVGFLMTGIVATWFTKYLDDLHKAREDTRLALNRTADAVREITDLLYERRTRGALLESSMRRGAPGEELKERKRLYDDIYVRWNSKLHSNVLRIRDAFHEDRFSNYEHYMNAYIGGLFIAIDRCLTDAYDMSISGSANGGSAANTRLDSCAASDGNSYKIETLEKVLLDCSSSFSDGLFYNVKSQDRREGSTPNPAGFDNEITLRCVLTTNPNIKSKPASP